VADHRHTELSAPNGAIRAAAVVTGWRRAFALRWLHFRQWIAVAMRQQVVADVKALIKQEVAPPRQVSRCPGARVPRLDLLLELVSGKRALDPVENA